MVVCPHFRLHFRLPIFTLRRTLHHRESGDAASGRRGNPSVGFTPTRKNGCLQDPVFVRFRVTLFSRIFACLSAIEAAAAAPVRQQAGLFD